MSKLTWWRRKDCLDSRIKGVIETSERARMAVVPKPPRVVIDMTHSRAPTLVKRNEPAAGPQGHGALFEPPLNGGEIATSAVAAHDGVAGSEAATDPADVNDGALALLEEVVERLERAEAREAEAREQADVCKAEAEEERQRSQQLETAASEAHEALSAALGERELLQQTLAEVSVHLTRLRRGRSGAAGVVAGMTGSQTEVLALVHEAVVEFEAALQHAELAEQEVLGLGERVTVLERQLAEERDSRRQAQARSANPLSLGGPILDDLVRLQARLEDSERQLAEVHLQAAGLASEGDRLLQLEAAVDAVRAERDAATERCRAVETAVHAEREARRRAEAARDEAMREAADARARLAGAGTAPEASKAAPVESAPRRATGIADEPIGRVPTVARPRAPNPEVSHGVVGETTAMPSSQQPDEAVVEYDDGDDEPADDGSDGDGSNTASQPTRREPRTAARTPVTIWKTGMSQWQSCTLLDKSASGARIELASSRFGSERAVVEVGDRLTLTFNSARESTSVPCLVIWAEGNECGVKYAGPFKTELVKPRSRVRTK